ncbi:hypothetical protein BH10BAC2_BH10BAC2_39770 [soil metagenome]
MEPAYAYEGLKIKIAVKGEAGNFPVPFIPEVNQFTMVMDHMAECIIYDKEPDTPGEEGLKDHVIIEAIYRSGKEKKIIELNNI